MLELGMALSPTSFVLHATARRHHWQGEGWLSIKTFRGGRARYESDGGLFAVDETRYLLLNHGQPYTIVVDDLAPVESFCVFFAPDLAGDVLRNLTTGDDRLLADPDHSLPPPHVFDRTYPHDDILSPTLAALRSALVGAPRPAGWLEEQFHHLLARLLHAQRGVYHEVERLPAARAATREELYHRAHRARDYAHAAFDQPLTLADLAGVACLSPNHLLRVFRLVFHQTPHHYLTSLRVAEARRLLRATDLSVTEIGAAVGLESLGSFSRLFRAHVGVSPQAYRRQTG